jgi:hypothetical protein
MSHIHHIYIAFTYGVNALFHPVITGVRSILYGSNQANITKVLTHSISYNVDPQVFPQRYQCLTYN